MKFKKCDCGCKGYDTQAGFLQFWVYWNHKENYYLYRGHGFCSDFIKDCRNMEEATRVAEDYVRDAIAMMTRALEER
jgi:hypothetical protein